jgi:hypothetical protein
MQSKVVDPKQFDKVLRAMLTAKPLSKEAIGAGIRARRKATQNDKQVKRSKQLRG